MLAFTKRRMSVRLFTTVTFVTVLRGCDSLSGRMTQSGDNFDSFRLHYAACVPATHAGHSSSSDEMSIPRWTSRFATFDYKKGKMSWNKKSVSLLHP